MNRYRWAAEHDSDIRAHVPRLRWLASLHPTVVEFGVRGGVSTAALLAGNPDTLDSYDIAPPPAWLADVDHPGFTFHRADVLTVPRVSCDLLFIDTLHTYEQLSAELFTHGCGVSRTIVMHDTHIPERQRNRAFNDPDGMWQAIWEFLAFHPEWHLVADFPDDNGLTVLARCGQ